MFFAFSSSSLRRLDMSPLAATLPESANFVARFAAVPPHVPEFVIPSAAAKHTVSPTFVNVITWPERSEKVYGVQVLPLLYDTFSCGEGAEELPRTSCTVESACSAVNFNPQYSPTSMSYIFYAISPGVIVSWLPETVLIEFAISEKIEARLDGVAAVSELPNASSIFYGI